MKIQLISSGLGVAKGVSFLGCFPPLGLLAIAQYVLINNPAVAIEILDEAIITENIENIIEGNIVGFYTCWNNYPDVVNNLAPIAKAKGALVVLGGPQATAIPDEIIMNNSNAVDAVIVGDGEEAVLALSKGMPFDKIPNIVYSNNNGIHRTPYSTFSINEQSFNYSNIDLDAYHNNFIKKSLNYPINKPAALYSQKGCLHRIKNKGCVYCSIQDSTYQVKDPYIFWNEVITLQNLGVDYIRDNSDSAVQNIGWLKNLAASKPNTVNVSFRFFARPDQITTSSANYLKKINTYDVYLGIESGVNELLKLANKDTNNNDNIEAVRILNDFDIIPRISILIGMPNEDRKTIIQTLNHVMHLKNLGGV